MINFPISSGAWYNLKSEVNGSQVRIYVNDKLVKEITMLGSGADARSDNYVGLWCHSRISIKGDSFQVQGNVTFLCYDMMTRILILLPGHPIVLNEIHLFICSSNAALSQ